MSKVKVQKVPADRLSEWPADPHIDMRDNPDHPADLSGDGWVFEFLGNFHGSNAHASLKGQKHYCRWLIGGYRSYEAQSVKQAFKDRCKKEGVTFVWLFKQRPPMSTRQVRLCEAINAERKADSGETKTEAA